MSVSLTHYIKYKKFTFLKGACWSQGIPHLRLGRKIVIQIVDHDCAL